MRVHIPGTNVMRATAICDIASGYAAFGCSLGRNFMGGGWAPLPVLCDVDTEALDADNSLYSSVQLSLQRQKGVFSTTNSYMF